MNARPSDRLRAPHTAFSRRRLAVAAVAGALLALPGCSDSSGGSTSSTTTPGATTTTPGATTTTASPSAPAGSAQIVIQNFAFSPATLTVHPGVQVVALNKDTTTHTVTATDNTSFSTGDIAPGKSATFTAPKKAGTYPYICSIHPFMKGTLTVS